MPAPAHSSCRWSSNTRCTGSRPCAARSWRWASEGRPSTGSEGACIGRMLSRSNCRTASSSRSMCRSFSARDTCTGYSAVCPCTRRCCWRCRRRRRFCGSSWRWSSTRRYTCPTASAARMWTSCWGPGRSTAARSRLRTPERRRRRSRRRRSLAWLRRSCLAARDSVRFCRTAVSEITGAEPIFAESRNRGASNSDS